MKTTNDGGPAFPTVARDGNWQPHHDGLSRRDIEKGAAHFWNSRRKTT